MRVTKWRVAAAIVALIALSTTTAYATHVFTDVDDSRFYADAAEWAKDNGITFGCGDGTTFCPDDPVTRGENVTFAKRYDDNVVQPALTEINGQLDVLQSVELRFGGGSFTADGDITYTIGCSWSDGSGEMRAGVPLPVGATITGFGGRFTGTGSDLDLVRIDATTGSIGTLTTSTSSFDLEEVTLATPEVVDEDKFYQLVWTPDTAGSSDRICGGLVHYTIGSAS